MEAMRDTWTDERLDDLARRMDRGFDCVDRDLRDLRTDVGAHFDRVDEKFEAMNVRFDAMQRTMLQIGGGLIGTLVVASVGLVATQL
jgi:hypothetical protein